MTAWAHLPNAAVIDDVLNDVSARPEVWATAAWSAEFGRAIRAARGVAPAYLQDRVVGTIMSAPLAAWAPTDFGTWARASRAIEGVTLALIAWDSSADLLRLTPDALRTIIDTCDGDVKHRAVLLLPAVIARSTP